MKNTTTIAALAALIRGAATDLCSLQPAVGGEGLAVLCRPNGPLTSNSRVYDTTLAPTHCRCTGQA